jgi:hypothetical protein
MHLKDESQINLRYFLIQNTKRVGLMDVRLFYLLQRKLLIIHIIYSIC